MSAKPHEIDDAIGVIGLMVDGRIEVCIYRMTEHYETVEQDYHGGGTARIPVRTGGYVIESIQVQGRQFLERTPEIDAAITADVRKRGRVALVEASA